MQPLRGFDRRSSPPSDPADNMPEDAAQQRRGGIHGALWALGWLLVAAMAAFQVYDVLRRRDIVLETAEHRLSSVARALSEQTAASVQVVDAVVRETVDDVQSSVPAHGNLLRTGLLEHLRSRLRATPQIRNLLVLGPTGAPIASGTAAPVEPDETGRRYVAAMGRDTSSNPNISSIFRLANDGSWTIALTRRIEGPRHEFLGVSVAYIDLDYFRRSYAGIELGPGSIVRLFHRDGTLLATYPGNASAIGRSFAEQPLFKQLSTTSEGASQVSNALVDGAESIRAAKVVDGLPLVVSVVVERAAIMQPWNIQASHSAVRTTLLCVSVLLLMWLVLRQLRRRERAEARLRVQKALLDELIESAPEAIVMLDLQEHVTRVNREFTRMFGYGASEAEGRTLDELIVPEDLAQEAARLTQAVSQGQHPTTETERRRKDGERLPVSVLGAPILTATRQIASYVIYRDLSEHKLAEAERGKLESRLRQAEKLEAIGTMAGGIAHDFNNVLGAILGYGDMALNAPPEGGALKRYLGNLMAAAHRAKALVDQILNYSRSTRGKRGVVGVHAVVEETLDLVRASLPADVELRTRLGAAMSTLIGDATQVHQLVMNLCTNAIHAMRSGGTLGVTLDTVDTAVDRAVSHGLLPAGRYVHLSVQDNGCGMEPAVVERIFEPFFTTRDVGSGIGLGLALVQGIVTELGGAIDVMSVPGKGSTFDIYLPRSDATVLEKASAEDALPRGDGERILLVEDEKAIMLLAEEMLAALGYEPAGFMRPADALTELRADPARFDAAVIDQLMPGMTGTELARHLREIRRDIPIVLVSGYTGPLLTQEALSAGIDQILTKPLEFRQLANAMAQLLARAPVR
jgi:PAS domain S-box-containing protein